MNNKLKVLRAMRNWSQAELAERLTVSRLRWETIVRLNRYLEFFGRLTTLFYVAFALTVVFGVDWRDFVRETLNSGEPIRGALILVLVLPTLAFVAAHSFFGWGRWRLQRELWRREVAALSGERTDSP